MSTVQRPINCTACHQSFQSWQNWREHRAIIRPWLMAVYDYHTRRCISQREWELAASAEMQAIQEEAREEHVCPTN